MTEAAEICEAQLEEGAFNRLEEDPLQKACWSILDAAGRSRLDAEVREGLYRTVLTRFAAQVWGSDERLGEALDAVEDSGLATETVRGLLLGLLDIAGSTRHPISEDRYVRFVDVEMAGWNSEQRSAFLEAIVLADMESAYGTSAGPVLDRIEERQLLSRTVERALLVSLIKKGLAMPDPTPEFTRLEPRCGARPADSGHLRGGGLPRRG